MDTIRYHQTLIGELFYLSVAYFSDISTNVFERYNYLWLCCCRDALKTSWNHFYIWTWNLGAVWICVPQPCSLIFGSRINFNLFYPLMWELCLCINNMRSLEGCTLCKSHPTCTCWHPVRPVLFAEEAFFFALHAFGFFIKSRYP